MKKALNILILSLIQVTSAFAIIGGEDENSVERNHVFQIAIQDDDNGSLCTAARIGTNIFITAAHCFDNNQNPKVIGISTKNQNPDFFYEGIEVQNVLIHPSYDSKELSLEEMAALDVNADMNADVALVFVTNNDYFNKIQISEMSFNYIESKEQVTYWGFGCQKTINNTNDYLPVKKFGRNITLGKEVLERDFGVFSKFISSRASKFYELNLLTAGLSMSHDGSSVCWGDSGGPVLHNGKIVGVNTSYLAKGMKEDGTSETEVTDINVHLRLSALKDWIEMSLGR